MNSRLSQSFGRLPLPYLVGALVALKALVLLLIVPLVQERLATSYGIGFADLYDVLARNLATGVGYRFFPDTGPTLMREPGYPLLLSVLFRVFGVSLTATRAFNLMVAFVAALMLARLARRVTGNEVAARIAVLLFLVHPGVVLAEARGGVEIVFILLLLLFVTLLYRALDSGRWRDYLLSGLALGLTATVRSTALLYPVFLLAWFCWWERVRPSVFVMAGRVALLGAAAGLMLVPWTIRNFRLTGEIVPTASVAGVSAYAGYHICTHLNFSNTMYDVDADASLVRERLAREAGLKFKDVGANYYLYFYDPHDELALSRLLGAEVRRHYAEDPLLLPTCAAKNLFNFWFAGKHWVATAVNVVIQAPYIVLAIAGLWFGMRSQRRHLYAPLLLFTLYTLAVYLPILALARYSVHLIPFLSIPAAAVLHRWLNRSASAETAAHGIG